MRIHEILIIPGAGHVGTGAYERGRVHGNLAEVDLVDKYVTALTEELDNSRVRHRIAPTRKAPGLSLSEIAGTIYGNTLVINCSIGWNRAKVVKAAHNISEVLHGGGSALIARELSQVLGHWGSLYVHGHRTAQPGLDTEDKTITVPETWGVRLEPFQINGANAQAYAQWLPKLGRDVGRFLADWCLERKDNAVLTPTTYAAPRDRAFPSR